MMLMVDEICCKVNERGNIASAGLTRCFFCTIFLVFCRMEKGMICAAGMHFIRQQDVNW